MLHKELEQARLDLNLSRERLAEMSGLKREQIRRLENGENFTRDTLLKVLPHLPNLQTLHLGAVELQAGGMETAEIREEMAAFLEHGRRILTLLERTAIAASPAQTSPAHPTVQVPPDMEQRLRRLEKKVGVERAADKRRS